MSSKIRRPKAFAVGVVRVRVHSGPREDGRWRWRADRPAGSRVVEGMRRDVREPVWSGWGTRDEAEVAVIDTLAQRGEGWVAVEELRTVFDLLDVWIGDYERRARSPRTSRHRRYSAQRIGRSELGAVTIAGLTRHAIERYRDARIADGGAASTTREDLVTLRMAWAWAVERSLIPQRPIPVVHQRVTRGDAVYGRYTPTPVEVAQVLRWLRPRWEWAYRMTRLLFATGCRRHELADCTWDQVDLEAGTIAIDARTKTGPRVVALHPEVVAELRTWSRSGPRVHGVQATTAAGALNERLRRATEALELPRWSTKGLRQAAVRAMFRSGADPGEEGAQLGHSAKVALRHYDEVRLEELHAAVTRAELGVIPELPPERSAGSNVIPFGRRR